MPRKKAVTNIEPTRRSSRLASREPSVASDTSEPGLLLPLTPNAPSVLLRPVAHCETSVRKLVPKKKLKNEAATWDVEGAIRVVKYKARNETDKKVDIYITSLTEDQRKAMIIGFAKQTSDLDDRNDELEGDVSSLGASLKAATENPMRRHLTLQAIHEKYGKREAELPKKSAVVSPPYKRPSPLPLIVYRRKSSQRPRRPRNSSRPRARRRHLRRHHLRSRRRDRHRPPRPPPPCAEFSHRSAGSCRRFASAAPRMSLPHNLRRSGCASTRRRRSKRGRRRQPALSSALPPKSPPHNPLRSGCASTSRRGRLYSAHPLRTHGWKPHYLPSPNSPSRLHSSLTRRILHHQNRAVYSHRAHYQYHRVHHQCHHQCHRAHRPTHSWFADPQCYEQHAVQADPRP